MRFARQNLSLAVVLLSTSIFIFSEQAAAQTRPGAAFLKILPGTRQQSLGNSLSGALDDPYLLYANPGATGLMREWQFSTSLSKWIADIYSASILYGGQLGIRTPWSRVMTFALGLNYQGVSAFDATRGAQPSASAKDVLINFSWGVPFGQIDRYFSIGGNAKWLYSKLDRHDASAFVFDVGGMLRTPVFALVDLAPFKNSILSGGVSYSQLGSELNFINTNSPLPRAFRAGLALNFGGHDQGQFQVSADFLKAKDQDGRFSFGVQLNNIATNNLAVRGGWNTTNDRNTDLLAKWSFGLSLQLDDYSNPLLQSPRNSALQVDFGYLQGHDQLGNVYQGTVGWHSLRPEPYGFVRSSYHGLLPDTPDFNYTTDDTVTLEWEATRDPDLYDQVNYLVFIARDDLPGLQSMLASTEAQEFDIFEFASLTQVSAENGRQVDVRVLGHKTATEKCGEDVTFGFPDNPHLESKYDTTFVVQRQSEILHKFRGHRFEPGDYFWTVFAYDKNRHWRAIETNGSSIAHFRVEKILKPDLQITLAKYSPPQPQTIPLNVKFAPDSSNVATMDQVWRDSLDEQVSQLLDLIYERQIQSLEIYGHTDSTGPGKPSWRKRRYNQPLSERRANSIRNYIKQGLTDALTDSIREAGTGSLGVVGDSVLVVNLGYPVSDSLFFRAVGHGEDSLLTKQPGESRRRWLARCRRVELKVNRTPQYFAWLHYYNVGEAPASDIQIRLADIEPELDSLQVTADTFVPDSLGRVPVSAVWDTTIASLPARRGDSVRVSLKWDSRNWLAQIDPNSHIDESLGTDSRELNNVDESSLPEFLRPRLPSYDDEAVREYGRRKERMYWYRYLGGSNRKWANSGERKLILLDENLAEYQHIFYGGNRVIFASDGSNLYWYFYEGINGAADWSGPPGQERRRILISDCLREYEHLFAGDDGEIYGADHSGNLWFYKYTGDENSADWENFGKRRLISEPGQFSGYKHIFAGEDGVIYASDDKHLYWHRYSEQDGWQVSEADNFDPARMRYLILASDYLNEYRQMSAGEDGEIFAVDYRGDVWRYRYAGSSGESAWAEVHTETANGDLGRTHVIGSGDFVDYRHVFAGEDGMLFGVGVGSNSFLSLHSFSSEMDHIFNGERLYSSNRKFYAELQNDGRLALFENRPEEDTSLWQSDNTPRDGVFRASIEPSGNLVIRDQNDTEVWSTNLEASFGNYVLAVSDDGQLRIYRGGTGGPAARIVWSSGHR